MDNLTFWAKIAEILGGFVWPVTVLLIVFLFRKQILAIIDNIVEFSGPGGWKIVLRQSLSEGRVALRTTEFPKPETGHRYARSATTLGHQTWVNYHQLLERLSLPNQMLAAYADLETVLSEIRKKRGLSEMMPFIAMLRLMEQQGVVTKAIVDAFANLLNARNALVHLRDKDVSVADATEFVSQAASLTEYFEAIRNEK